MKKVAYIFGGLVLLSLLFLMFAPDTRLELLKSEWRRQTGDIGQECFDMWSSDLNDPASAIVGDYDVVGDQIFVLYSAKNSFGAYEKGSFDCPLRNGKIDRVKLVLERSQEAIEQARRLHNN